MSVEQLLPTFEQFDASLFDPSLLLNDVKLSGHGAAHSAAAPMLLNFTAMQQQHLHQQHQLHLHQQQQQQQRRQQQQQLQLQQQQQQQQQLMDEQDGMSDLSSSTGDEDMSGLDTFPLSHHFDFLNEIVPASPDTDASSMGGSPLVLGMGADGFERHMSSSSGMSADGTRPVRQVRLQGSIRRRYEQLMPELAENKKKLNKRRKKAPIDVTKLTKNDREALEVDRLEKNRQSARDCRLRKKFYIKSLEQKVEEFEIREQQRLADLDQAHHELEEVRKRYELLVKHYQQLQPFGAAATSTAFPL
jgi:hypothetical protein